MTPQRSRRRIRTRRWRWAAAVLLLAACSTQPTHHALTWMGSTGTEYGIELDLDQPATKGMTLGDIRLCTATGAVTVTGVSLTDASGLEVADAGVREVHNQTGVGAMPGSLASFGFSALPHRVDLACAASSSGDASPGFIELAIQVRTSAGSASGTSEGLDVGYTSDGGRGTVHVPFHITACHRRVRTGTC